MNGHFEAIIVATLIIAAASYLALTFVRNRRSRANGEAACGKASCGCGPSKTPPLSR